MGNGDRVQIGSRREWRAWLGDNHEREDGIWLVRFKKHRGDKYVSYNDVVEEALCFGWIDSRPRKLDEDRTMLWLAPRRPGSRWSKLNKERVARMTAAELMSPPGLGKVKAAKQDGSWTALDAIEALVIPPDLEIALASYESARRHFDAFPPSVKRGILEWIADARMAATRAKRVEETARLAQDNVRAHHWRR